MHWCSMLIVLISLLVLFSKEFECPISSFCLWALRMDEITQRRRRHTKTLMFDTCSLQSLIFFSQNILVKVCICVIRALRTEGENKRSQSKNICWFASFVKKKPSSSSSAFMWDGCSYNLLYFFNGASLNKLMQGVIISETVWVGRVGVGPSCHQFKTNGIQNHFRQPTKRRL